MQLPEGAAWVRPARVAESEVEKPKKPGVVAWRASGLEDAGKDLDGAQNRRRRSTTVSGRWEGNDEEMVMVMMGDIRF